MGISLSMTTKDSRTVQVFIEKNIGALKEVKMDESNIDIDRKIRAFWRPPFHGANIRIGSKQYTLVSDEILRELAEMYKEK